MAASWTHCRSPGTGTGSPGTAAPTTCWRPRAASRSGCRVRSALQDKAAAAVCALCTVQTHAKTQQCVHSQLRGRSRWFGGDHPPLCSPNSHFYTLPPSQAKPAQIHKLMPPPSSPDTPPTLSHSLHNLPPEGNPIPASQTRLDANVISDYRRSAHISCWDRHCLLFSSCLRPKRGLPLNQFHLHHCLFMIYSVKAGTLIKCEFIYIIFI